jgi:hypothetical protein
MIKLQAKSIFLFRDKSGLGKFDLASKLIKDSGVGFFEKR